MLLDISDSNPKPFRFRIRTLLILVAVAAVVSFAVSTMLSVNNTIRGSYAVWWVADMCIEHMEANNGEWPSNWDDLRDDYQTCITRSGQPWTFDELSSRAEIDWEANPIELLPITDDSDVQIRVIWLRSGSDSHWSGREPNTMILDYLKTRSGRTPIAPGG